jgi:hypothetical protein
MPKSCTRTRSRGRRFAVLVVAIAAAAIVFGSSTPTRPPGGASTTRAPATRTIRTWSAPNVPGPAPAPIELPAARPHVPPPIQGTPEMAAWVVPLRGQPPLGEGWDPQADVVIGGAAEGE